MEVQTVLITIIIILALVFAFINGFHDASNAIATLVVSRGLQPVQALILASAANFAGYFTFGVAVATFIGQGLIRLEAINLGILTASLASAIIWNLFTWYLALPSSSSHALIGGLIGAALAGGGGKSLISSGIIQITAFVFIAPFLGLAAAYLVSFLVYRLFRKSRPEAVNRIFLRLQLVSAFFYSAGHGSNDAQKVMGIIAVILVSGGINHDFHLDPWVILASYSAIALGTLFGGWRIVRTLGTRITRIRPLEAFCSQTASSLVLFFTALTGTPVSTTHVISGAIAGTGLFHKASRVRWSTAGKIAWAWIFTIPVTAGLSAILSAILHSFKALGG